MIVSLRETNWNHKYPQDINICLGFTTQAVWKWERQAKPGDRSSYHTGSCLSKKQSQYHQLDRVTLELVLCVCMSAWRHKSLYFHLMCFGWRECCIEVKNWQINAFLFPIRVDFGHILIVLDYFQHTNLCCVFGIQLSVYVWTLCLCVCVFVIVFLRNGLSLSRTRCDGRRQGWKEKNI